jgi:hypothetical protein
LESLSLAGGEDVKVHQPPLLLLHRELSRRDHHDEGVQHQRLRHGMLPDDAEVVRRRLERDASGPAAGLLRRALA